MVRTLGTTLTVLLFSGSVLAVKAGSSPTALQSLRTIRCEFDEGSFTVWTEKGRSTEKGGGMPALTFDSLKPGKTGNGRLIGNAGSADVLYFRTRAGLTLTETTGMGGVNITTIFEAQSEPGRFKAVHSRHLEGIAGLMLSQYYGICRRF